MTVPLGRCRHCKSAVESFDQFCGLCGARIPGTPIPEPKLAHSDIEPCNDCGRWVLPYQGYCPRCGAGMLRKPTSPPVATDAHSLAPVREPWTNRLAIPGAVAIFFTLLFFFMLLENKHAEPGPLYGIVLVIIVIAVRSMVRTIRQHYRRQRPPILPMTDVAELRFEQSDEDADAPEFESARSVVLDPKMMTVFADIPSDPSVFFRHPGIGASSAVEAMAAALSLIHARDVQERWLTIAAEGQGAVGEPNVRARFGYLKGKFDFGAAAIEMPIDALAKQAGVPFRCIAHDGERMMLVGATPREEARIFDILFRYCFGISPFPEANDYAVIGIWV